MQYRSPPWRPDSNPICFNGPELRMKWKIFAEAMNRDQQFIQTIDICRHLDDRNKKTKEEGNHKDQ